MPDDYTEEREFVNRRDLFPSYLRVSPYTDFRRLFYDVLNFYSPLTKVFWKGEFEGKNLFFKKGFPLLIKLEKTSLIGSQLAGDRKFFQGGETPDKNSHEV